MAHKRAGGLMGFRRDLRVVKQASNASQKIRKRRIVEMQTEDDLPRGRASTRNLTEFIRLNSEALMMKGERHEEPKCVYETAHSSGDGDNYIGLRSVGSNPCVGDDLHRDQHK
jgi:hypothetical protein